MEGRGAAAPRARFAGSFSSSLDSDSSLTMGEERVSSVAAVVEDVGRLGDL